ncbi:MAG: L-threonylcarbamoyladenylate synthase [Verrucomicrobiaceae bacterium]
MDTKLSVADFEDWRDTVDEAVALLAEGEVVALPTETVYGLAACAFNAEAVSKVFEVKERPSFDPLIVHIGRKDDLDRVAVVPEDVRELVDDLIKEYWPGPLTLVLPKKAEVPDLVTSGLDTVAVRLSAHEIMREVAKVHGPIAAPSANRFGRISPTSAQAVMEELGGRIPLIIDGGACRDGLESTIVAPTMTEKGPVLRLLRPGPISKEDLRKFGKVERVKNKPGGKVEAPGQIESHYAPATPLMVVEKPGQFVPEEGKKYGLLSYRGEGGTSLVNLTEWEAVETLSPGKGKLSEASVRLFYCLRKLDAAGVDLIVAEAVSNTGVGVAIMDRLKRAASAKS